MRKLAIIFALLAIMKLNRSQFIIDVDLLDPPVTKKTKPPQNEDETGHATTDQNNLDNNSFYCIPKSQCQSSQSLIQPTTFRTNSFIPNTCLTTQVRCSTLDMNCTCSGLSRCADPFTNEAAHCTNGQICCTNIIQPPKVQPPISTKKAKNEFKCGVTKSSSFNVRKLNNNLLFLLF